MKKESKEVVIVYENVVRELDNSLLLMAELEQRGCSVKLVYKPEGILWKHRSGVVLLPNCYNTKDYEKYNYLLNTNGSEYICLHYEQVLSKRVEKIGIHNPKGKAKDIWMLCWGENCYKRLVDYGISKRMLRICGAMQLDFLREEFCEFYMSRTEIAKKYGLDESKKWMLYISSFSYVDNTIIAKYTGKELGDYEFVKKFTEISTKSQRATLGWFEKFVCENQDVIIIYRKHPVEAANKNILALKHQYPERFFDISDLSVKQWIKVSDIITTWFSTSAAEVYMAKKPLQVIRPYPIEMEYDVPYYYNANCIDSYDKLKDIANADESVLINSIPEDVIKEYYFIDELPAYVRVADTVEEAFKNPTSLSENRLAFAWNRILYLLKDGKLAKYIVKKSYQFIYLKTGWQLKNSKLRKQFEVSDWEKRAEEKYDEVYLDKYRKLKEVVRKYYES